MVAACPDDVELLAVIEGRAAPARVVEHAETCAACRELLGDALAAARDDATTPDLAPEQVDAPPTLPADAPYALGAMLAEGGMGRIYRARDRALGRDVVLKVPRSRSRAIEVRFEREVAITARLDHPGIVPVHGAGRLLDGRRYYVMRFVDGTGLDAAIAAAADPAARLALLPHLQAVADAMAFAHQQGVIHRDLKPNNVLIGRFGEAVIIDWGLAKVVRAATSGPLATRASTLLDGGARVSGVIGGSDMTPEVPTAAYTRVGDVLGTPAYMAPEQARGDAVDARADVYALGGMLRAILTGDLAVRDKAVASDVAAPALVALCRAAMADDPAARPADGAAFAAALSAATSVTAAPARRARAIRGLAIATALVLAAAAGAWLVRDRAHRAMPGAAFKTEPLMDGAVRIVGSPSGRRLCAYSEAEMTVIDLPSGARWTRVGFTIADTVQFVDEERVAFVRPVESGSATKKIDAAVWTFATGRLDPREDARAEARFWVPLATTAVGGLTRAVQQPFGMAVDDGRTWRPLGSPTQHVVFALSPDRRRLVSTQPEAASSTTLVVVDLARGVRLATSAPIRDVTAIGWRDDAEVVVAAGPPGASAVHTWAFVGAPTLAPRPLLTHTVAGEWIGGLIFTSAAIVAVITHSTTTTHLLDLQDSIGKIGDVVLDAQAAAALMSWRSPSVAVVWNRGAARLEDLGLAGEPTAASPVVAEAPEPYNGSRAGDLLLVTSRSSSGRVVAAYAPGEATPRWQRAPGELEVARCAGDVAPPCVAVAAAGDDEVVVRSLDLVTGSPVGDELARAGGIGDIAVRADGQQLAWVEQGGALWVRDLASTQVPAPPRQLDGHFVGARTIAYAADGALLIGRQELGRTLVRVAADGRITTLWRTDVPVLSLVRPSPDGRHIAVRTRAFANELRITPWPASR